MSEASLSGPRVQKRPSRRRGGGPSSFRRSRPRAVRLGAVLAVFVVTGCATKADVRDLQTEIQALADQQDRVLGSLEGLQLSALDSLGAQADVLFQIRGELNRQILEIQEQLVTIQELTGQSQRALAGLRDQLEARRTAIVQQERPETAADSARVGSGPGAADAGLGAPTPGTDAQELYNVALSQFNRGSVTTARAAFDRFLTAYPNHRLAPDAHFYLADIQVQENRLEEALEGFLEIPELFPAADRVPQALYRAAQIQDELGNEDEARDLYQRVVNSYPDSGAAILAEERLADL